MAVDRKTYECAAELIRREDMVDMLRSLIRIKSPFFEESEIISYLYGRLSASSRLESWIHRYEEKKITGFRGENLVVRLPGSGSGPTLLLNAHVDTVPLCDGWTVDPYRGIEKGDRLYGLGALDMKAGVVIAAALLEALAESGAQLQGDLLFTAVSGEEGPFGLGTHYTILDGVVKGCDYAIITEPSGPFAPEKVGFPCVALGGRGSAIYFVSVKGRSAHGATPELGINAVDDAARLITALNRDLDPGSHPVLGRGSLTITNLFGGEKYLLIPEEVTFTIYRHIVEEKSDRCLLDEVEAIVASLDLESEVEVRLRELPHPEAALRPWVSGEETPPVRSLRRACAEVLGCKLATTYFRSESDANHLACRLGIPTLIFGPGGANYHAADEYVEIESMVDSARVLLYTAIDLLS